MAGGEGKAGGEGMTGRHAGELAGAIAGLYQRHAAAFDRRRTRSLFERGWLERFSALAGSGAPVLDLGCGCGEPIARFLVEAGHPLTGVDTSEAMVALCRARLPGETFHVADMRGLDLGRRFAGILAWDSFFHLGFDDQRAMFPVFRAHAAPGAALMFTSGPAHGEAIGTFEGEALYHASLDPAAYRALLAANGFEVVRHVADDPECYRHTVWLARAG
ncbi:class I SAM-dependent DNA methyltransferase [Faunimonas sp. B44]|uniref:class I SAM-dependent DNA methyltransferase n=1 Tax=Faunimonas sp. B44 TaxID=3461493 RepID=UPI00404513C4